MKRPDLAFAFRVGLDALQNAPLATTRTWNEARGRHFSPITVMAYNRLSYTQRTCARLLAAAQIAGPDVCLLIGVASALHPFG
jgi:hypothetical protein